MMLLENAAGEIVVVDVRLRDRLSARLHADRIDQQLADGRSPDSAVPVALRAARLIGTRHRRQLAIGVRRLIDEMTEPSAPWVGRLPLNRAAVSASLPELTELERRLLDRGPVAARGVAAATVLLTDGVGPLRSRRHADRLAGCLHEILRALDVVDSEWSANRWQ